jgi:peptide/nickel transport system substrate-binding protein
LDKGGWSVFHTNVGGLGMANPAAHIFLHGNGRDAAPGWPVSSRIEELRTQWLRTSDVPAQKHLAKQIQLQAFQDVPYIPLGQMITPTAYRADLTGIIDGGPFFWNIRRV